LQDVKGNEQTKRVKIELSYSNIFIFFMF